MKYGCGQKRIFLSMYTLGEMIYYHGVSLPSESLLQTQAGDGLCCQRVENVFCFETVDGKVTWA